MKYRRFFTILFALSLAQTSVGGVAPEADWPQWHGPDRTGVSTETGLLKSWPASGPAAAWTASNLGEGFGSVAIKGDRVFVQGTRGGESVVFCLSRSDGKPIWTQALGPKLNEGRGNGPRSTPAVDGDRVYALSENGDLASLKAADGAVVWQRNILKDFGGSNPGWLISESPLIDGNNLIVTPGGQGASLVALDKISGKTVWTSKELSDPAGYSSCVAADIQGVRSIIGFTAKAAVGLRATDGKLMWRYAPVANRVANITTPIIHDNKVFYTSAYDTGCALLGLKAQGGEVKAEEIYFSRDMMNHHGGVVLVNGYLYGFSNNILTCMEFATGKTMWKDRSVGKGSVTYADGNLYLLSENNVVGLAEASPAGYKEKGRFQIADQGWPSWAHPVVCGGRLYIRNQGTLTSYEIKAR
ncbi:MAG TPA: PQQ-binding-like beta-propeller repeat protein [Blastocatellia bacterium]|nr:PQQ-binding-like beta-propeller repeat protein [Blastocatellia bacterium]